MLGWVPKSQTMFSCSWNHRIRPLFCTLLLLLLLLVLVAIIFFPTSFPASILSPSSFDYAPEKLSIWMAHRMFEWRPCIWWMHGALTEDPIAFLLKYFSFAYKNQSLY